jgi:hypothetical protein
MVVFVVIARSCSVVTRDGCLRLCQVIPVVACPAIVARDVRCTCHDGFVFFVLLASAFLYVLLLIPRSLQEIWGMNLPNLPDVSCI